MFLERLSLKNFKSFGGTHELALASGFTAVVGPNGSGKSNLLDALRWVLGDGNASRLRITRLGDLAFQGSISLGRSSDAEVFLRLREFSDNAEGGRGRTCILGRKIVPEDGGSVFLLDGTRVRLQDIDEAKRAWHLEGDRFAFIGQGEVAEVVQQRPGARRAHLEALFGIDLYRRRRDEAVGRLGSVGEELRRLEMLQSELESRRQDIAPAVVSATQARILMEALQEARRDLYWRRRREAERELMEIHVLQKERRRLAGVLAGWKRGWEGVLRRFEEAAGVEWAREATLGQALEEAVMRRNLLHRKAFSAGTALRGLKDRIGALKEACRNLEVRREQCCGALEVRRDEEALLRKEGEEAKRRLSCAETALWGLRSHQDAERLRRDEASATLASSREEGLHIVGRLGALGRRWHILWTEERERRRELEQSRRDLAETQRRLDRSEQEAKDAAQRYGDAYALCQGIAGDLQRERREVSGIRHRIEELRERLQGNLYPRPVQHILSAVRLGRLDAHPVPALETFQCPPSLLAPLDAYLGGRRFWIFVHDLAEAGRCIDQLKKAGVGRATFLPMEQARPRSPDRRISLPSRGVVGWAQDLITPLGPWGAGVSHLLGDLLVVERYAVGADLARQGGRMPVVTLEGDVFLPGGTVSGGGSGRETGPLELRHQLALAESEAGEREKALTELEWSLKEAEGRMGDAARLREETASVLEQVKRTLAERRGGEDRLSRAVETLGKEGADLWQTLGEAGRRLRVVRDLERESERVLVTLAAVPEEHGMVREVTELQGLVALAEEKRRGMEALLIRETEDLRQVEATIRSQKEALRVVGMEVEEKKEELRTLGREILEVWRSCQALEEERFQRQERLGLLGKRRSRAQLRSRVASERMEAERLLEIRLEKMSREIVREVEDLTALWEAQFPYTTEAVVDEERSLEELRRQLRDRERQLRELGDVNLGVLSEDRSLVERMAFLQDQVQDVTKAMEELQGFIVDTDAQAGGLFSQALQGIDCRFNELFQRLFGGGEARLVLTEGVSLWDAGVEVMARPPGKRPQHLGQLSGGEQSLTAIALLFAAMEVAEAPLAVLDEVDAALDEANLKRFAALAEEYACSRQLIVMTHRRYTMERAQILYGVTMSEPGLSQVVGVRLEDWT